MRTHLRFVPLLLLLLPPRPVMASMILFSDDFAEGALIPGDYGCDIVTGEDRSQLRPSPSLEWARVPASAQSLVLVVDGVEEGSVLWVVAAIPKVGGVYCETVERAHLLLLCV